MLRAGICMAKADGKYDDSESHIIALCMEQLGVGKFDIPELFKLAEAMNLATMVSILSLLEENQKKFVCGFLAAIMISDGDVDETEVKLWQLTSTFCGFPTMTIIEAFEFWKSL